MKRGDKVRIVLVTCGNLAEARRIARAVVEKRLAACVNILPGAVKSVYRWKDKVETARERLLIIKLDAMGDVLRTTALLPALAEVHPQAAIDWITRPESVPLLGNNPHLADVVPYGPDALIRLQTILRREGLLESLP